MPSAKLRNSLALANVVLIFPCKISELVIFAYVFVELQVMGGCSNAGYIRFTVAGEIANNAISGGDSPVVQHCILPLLCPQVGRLIRREPAAFAAEPANDLIAVVAVEVSHREGVAVVHLVIEHEPLPRLSFLKIDHQLISMPRLNRGQKAVIAKAAQAYLTAAA